MAFIRLYLRVLGLLRAEAKLAVMLALANIALAGAQFVEPVLLGRIVDALSGTLPVGLAAAALAGLAFVPGLGYVEAAVLPLLALRARRREPERHAGLRTLARD